MLPCRGICAPGCGVRDAAMRIFYTHPSGGFHLTQAPPLIPTGQLPDCQLHSSLEVLDSRATVSVQRGQEPTGGRLSSPSMESMAQVLNTVKGKDCGKSREGHREKEPNPAGARIRRECG